MIRYGYAGRRFPRYVPDHQGVIHWDSVGAAGFQPAPAGTRKRLYHNWILIGGPYNSVFVWQNAGGEAVIPPVITVSTVTTGMGPGWNLFDPSQGREAPRRRRPSVADEVEESIRRALERAEDAETRPQRRAAIKDLQVAVGAAVALAPQISDRDLAVLAAALATLGGLRLGLSAYLEAVSGVMTAEELRRDDDMTAFMLIAGMA